VLGECGQVALGQFEHAARAQNGFGDERRQVARRLPIHKGERIVELGAPVISGSRAERSAQQVGRRDGEVADTERTVPLPSERVGRRRGAAGHTMPTLRESDHLIAAGDQLGQPQRSLVGLRAGAQEHRPIQRRRSDADQRLRQRQHGLAQHARKQVVERRSRL